ncbi:hypothetical protein PWT90_09587 [Aphanocladium album]|nr:hypothetical protein PWT90_09587 [Aphanocladium album]
MPTLHHDTKTDTRYSPTPAWGHPAPGTCCPPPPPSPSALAIPRRLRPRPRPRPRPPAALWRASFALPSATSAFAFFILKPSFGRPLLEFKSDFSWPVLLLASSPDIVA